jgi:hypothetical protein
MSMIGSSVKPRPWSLMPPEISMKKTLPTASPPCPLSSFLSVADDLETLLVILYPDCHPYRTSSRRQR